MPTRRWTTQGFEAFRQGTFANAGQNLYVSQAGVLQRIHQYDLDQDGQIDLVFCNSQNHLERAPAFVIRDPLGSATTIELPAEGSRDGLVVDLNGNGFPDLVLAFDYNGVRFDLNSTIYYGSADGLTERYQQQLPTPGATSVAAGGFRGHRRMDLAFVCGKRIRLFEQDENGFEPHRFAELPMEADAVAAADLNGDGYAELLVRTLEGRVLIYQGSLGGLNLNDPVEVPIAFEMPPPPADPHAIAFVDSPHEVLPHFSVVWLGDQPHIFVARHELSYLVPVGPDLHFGDPVELNCQHAMAVAVGDVDGDGQVDLVVACREEHEDGQRSWVYWGSEDGFSSARRSALPTRRVCDVAVADFRCSGCDDIVFAHGHNGRDYTTDSWLYRGTRDRVFADPLPLRAHEPHRVIAYRPRPQDDPQLVFVNHFGRNMTGHVNVYIYHGGNDGYAPERRTELPGHCAVEGLCCDINDDGYADLLVVNCSENAPWLNPGSFLYQNGPDGFDANPAIIFPTRCAHGVACGDLNRNGFLDLIFSHLNNDELLIFGGTPEGFDLDNPTRIRMVYEGKTYSEPRWLYLADLNNDGWLDLVIPQCMDPRSFILWGGPDGFSMERCQALRVRNAICTRAVDLTGNGYLDLILGGLQPTYGQPHDSFVYIYWNGPEGLREDRRQVLPAEHVNAMSVADFNRDGNLDLFCCSYHDGRERDIASRIYWNQTGRGFSSRDFSRLHTHSASGCFAADFNEDGYIDLAVANHKTDGDHVGLSDVWWNGPEGFDAGHVTKLPTMGPHGMCAVEPGNIADRGPEEYYLSRPFELPSDHHVERIIWEADIPPKTWVRAHLRFAGSAEGLNVQPWQGSDGAGTWYENRQPVVASTTKGRWLQYRLAIGAINSGRTPRITAVHVDYGQAGAG